jgi:hypothetical protein
MRQQPDFKIETNTTKLIQKTKNFLRLTIFQVNNNMLVM